ncbi:MAG: hypothetical protein ACREEM_10470 [Blastocatellia bacterium]
MTKIALSILALAALSTASFADRSRDDFGTNSDGFRTYSGDTIVKSAPPVVHGGQTSLNDDGGKQGGR